MQVCKDLLNKYESESDELNSLVFLHMLHDPTYDNLFHNHKSVSPSLDLMETNIVIPLWKYFQNMKDKSATPKWYNLQAAE